MKWMHTGRKKQKFELKPIHGYVISAIVLLLLFSPYLYEAIFNPYDYDQEYEYDLPPRIMYNGSLYHEDSRIQVEDKAELILVGQIESISREEPTQNFQANDAMYLHCNLYMLDSSPELLVLEYRKKLFCFVVDWEVPNSEKNIEKE